MTDHPLLAFYDSGIGGLPYVESCRALMPGATFVYYADSAHFPLGVRPAPEVKRIVEEAVATVIRVYDPDVLVIACNTASVLALASLRERHPERAFVGTVPAIKPAAEQGRGGIAVLGSERTVTDPYTAGLVEKFARGRPVHLQGAPDWIEFVELSWLESSSHERQEIVRPLIEELIAKGVDSLVLACTHFLYLEDDIREVVAGRASVIDSAEGVARRAKDLALSARRPDDASGKKKDLPAHDIFHSSAAAPRLFPLASRFGFTEGGILS